LNVAFEALGRRMLDRKKELVKKGIRTDSEHAMVEAPGGTADSRAAAANRRTTGGPRKTAALSFAKQIRASAKEGESYG
jgi:hypothetical protein